MTFASPGPAGVLAPQWTLITIAGCILIALLHLRLNIQKQKLLISDILMCTTWCSAVITSSFDIKFALLGALDPAVRYGLEGYTGTMEDIRLFIKIAWVSSIPFIMTTWLCKASLLAVYLQVFPAFMVKRRIFLWATVTYSIASLIGSLVASICICLPIERNWALDPEDLCVVEGGFLVFQVTWALHFFGDLVVFILPWLILPDLQLKGPLRIGIYYTFLLGLVDIAVCLTRFITIQTASIEKQLPLSLLELLAALDYSISLVIACLPSLRPYFRIRQEKYGKNSYCSQSTSTRGRDPTSMTEVDVRGDS